MDAYRTSNLTIGIPVRTFWQSGLSKASELRASGFLGPILISVHSCPDIDLETHARIKVEANRINATMLVSEQPLSLYANFYKLVGICETEFFCWVALDDWPSIELLNLETEFRDFDLAVTDVVLREYEDGVFGRSVSEHRAAEFFDCNQFVIHPFFIFGVWSRDFLLKIWPSSDFDYLDTFLLYRTRFEGRVKTFGSVRPAWIGYQEKTPHSVREGGHSMWRWAVNVLTSRTFWLNWGGNRAFVQVAYSHFQFSKRTQVLR